MPVTDILEFPTSQFRERNLAYRTVGVYRSCVSQFHDLIDGHPVGDTPIILRFVKGISELQAPKPKVSTTWSVDKVVGFLQEVGPIESLSLHDLSLKLAMLLALTSAARVHKLTALDKVNVPVKKESLRFLLFDTSRVPGQTMQGEK